MVREEMFRLEQPANVMAGGNELEAVVIASTKTARETHDA